MPKSSRHKSHKQSKHSSRDYSDSEEDVVKMKEKSSKDDSVRTQRDSASGEKRKFSSQAREGKDGKDLTGHGNGNVSEEYVSSKRRKEKTDVTVGGDRWNEGGDERGDSDRNVEKDVHKVENLKVDSKGKENSGKGESLKVDSKNKSKRYESGNAGERKEDSLDREDSKSKGDSKRKSEREASARKEGKELKDKDRKSEKERNGGHDSKSGDDEVKLVDMNVGKKQGTLSGDFIEERQGKRSRENTERALLDEMRTPDLDKEMEKKIRRKGEGSTEREKHYDDAKEDDGRQISSKGDLARDVKYRDDKHKDGVYADKYQEDGYRDDRGRDEKYRVKADKDYKYRDDKYREDGEKDVRRRDDRHREDGGRDNRRKDEKHREDGERVSRRKDEKHREDGERDSRRKDEKYREDVERDGRQDDKYYDDGDRDNKHKDDRYHRDGDKDFRRGDERYNEDGDRDNRGKENTHRDEAGRDNGHTEEKYREDSERDTHFKDSKQGGGCDRDKKSRDGTYKDERTRDRSVDKSDLKRSRDDSGAADHYARTSSAYDGSPKYDDRASRYRDDQGRRRTKEKEDYSDIKSQGTKDQRPDAEKKSTSNLAADRVKSSSRNADLDLTSSHGRRRSSPTSNSHASRDQHRTLKQDDSKYRDYNCEERIRPSSRDHAVGVGGSEKASSSHSFEKLVDKSPSSSTDRRQFSRPDVRRSIDIEESTPKIGFSRDWKDYAGKETRGAREVLNVLPGEELLQGNTDNISVSSPFARTGHFSSGYKPYPPAPLFRTGVDSPLRSGLDDDDGRGKSSMLRRRVGVDSPLGSGLDDDDGRGKSSMRHRRVGDPNMGRIQASPWRGVPSWPSPVANGFLPFPHAPPPVGFHSVMQPFPAPPMFGARPSIELNHPGAYHMPEADRFSGPGRSMGWHNQVDDSFHPLHAWDASNAAFGDESHIYGRSDWDHSRNLPGTRGWDASVDYWKGPNRSGSMEVLSSEKENNSVRSEDEALGSQSTQLGPNEQSQVDQQADSPDISQPIKSFEKNETVVSLENSVGVNKISRKENLPLYHVYLSQLDISHDLTEPDLLKKCIDLIAIEQSISSDVDDCKILYIEDLEAKTQSLLNYALFGYDDDSVFQKSISLYKRQKEHSEAKDAEKLKVLSNLVRKSSQESVNIADDTEKLPPVNDMQRVEVALPNFNMEIDHKNDVKNDEGHAETNIPVAVMTEKPEDPVFGPENINLETTPVLDLGPKEQYVKEMPFFTEGVEGSSSLLLPDTKDLPAEYASNDEEVRVVETKCDPLLNSDVFSEAMMPESMVPGSVNLSRIHHSPESTH